MRQTRRKLVAQTVPISPQTFYPTILTPNNSEARHQIIVAGVLVRDGKYLVIEEMVGDRPMINQPAGRLEPGEKTCAGAVRETQEESGYLFTPTALVGIYHWYSLELNTIYLRLAYTGDLLDIPDAHPSDPQILAVHWFSIPELEAQASRLRSPFVLQCVRDHAAGQRFPLDLVSYF